MNLSPVKTLIKLRGDEAFRKITVYAIFGILPILSGFFLTPFYTRFLTQEEYGKLSYFNVIQGYITLVLLFGLDNSLSRFFFEFRSNDEKVKKMFSTAFQFIFLLAVLAYIITYLLSFKFDFFKDYNLLNLLITNALFTVLSTTFLNYYRDGQLLKRFSFYSCIQFVGLSLGSIFGILFFSNTAIGCIKGRAIGLLACCLPLFITHANYFFKRADTKLFKDLLRFGIPFIPYSLIGTFYESLDRVLIEKYFSFEKLAVYNIAFVIGFMANVLVNALMQTYNPKVFNQLEAVKNNTLSDTPENLRKLRSNMFTILSVAILLLSACCYPIIFIFAGKSYLQASIYIPILAFAYLMRLYYVVYSIPLFFHKQTFVLPIILSISAISFLLFYYTVGIYLGVLGIALSVLFSRILQVLSTKFFSSKCTESTFDIYSGIHHKIIILTGVTCLALSVIYYVFL